MTTSLGKLTDFPLDTPTQIKANGQTLLVLRTADDPDDVCVVVDKCPHAGLSLSKGPRGGYADGVITCPWHNSRFDMCSGENLDWTPGVAGVNVPRWSRKLIAMGKSPAPLDVLAVTITDGEITLVDD